MTDNRVSCSVCKHRFKSSQLPVTAVCLSQKLRAFGRIGGETYPWIDTELVDRCDTVGAFERKRTWLQRLADWGPF